MITLQMSHLNIREINGKLHSSRNIVVESPAELEIVSALCAHAILAKNGFGASDEVVRDILNDISKKMRQISASITDYEANLRTYRNELEIALAQARERASGSDRLKEGSCSQ